MKQYDIAIVGSGMAGSTLALALDMLSQGQLRIALIESFAPSSSHPGFDARSIALSYSSQQILSQLNLWPDMVGFAEAITDIHVSDKSHLAMTQINSRAQAVDALGYVVELHQIGQVLQQKITHSSAIDFVCPHKVEEIERQSQQVIVKLSGQRQLSTQLLVAADGTMSHCCQLLGHQLQEQDFYQTALITNVVTQLAPQGRAFERFTPSGPLAFLPLSQGRSSVVWCLSHQQAQAALHWCDEQFSQALQQEFGWRLGRIEKVGQRHAYPLQLRYRQQLISHRFAMVGNAAQTLHPVAGQGFNLGMRDVMTLAQLVVSEWQQSLSADIGRYQVLSRYQQSRQADREATMALTSSLVHCFSNDLPAMRIGRNLALCTIDVFNPLRQPIIARALGLS